MMARITEAERIRLTRKEVVTRVIVPWWKEDSQFIVGVLVGSGAMAAIITGLSLLGIIR